MRQISPRVLYLNRNDWGAKPEYPRLGDPLVPRRERRYNIIHHTVGVDNDATKNVWENLDEVKVNARMIQTVRLDLGADVPYNFLLYLMSDSTIVVCEGRGYDRWGAHTAGVVPGRTDPYRYFNGCGIATSFAGNFEDIPIDLSPWEQAINDWNQDLKRELPNLGTQTICGKTTCGHKDYAPYHSLNQTACCGQYLYAFLPKITLEENDVTATQQLFEAGTFEFLASDVEQGFPLNAGVCQDALTLIGHDGPEIAVHTRSHAHGLLMYAAAEAKRGQSINTQAASEIRYLCKNPQVSVNLA